MRTIIMAAGIALLVSCSLTYAQQPPNAFPPGMVAGNMANAGMGSGTSTNTVTQMAAGAKSDATGGSSSAVAGSNKNVFLSAPGLSGSDCTGSFSTPIGGKTYRMEDCAIYKRVKAYLEFAALYPEQADSYRAAADKAFCKLDGVSDELDMCEEKPVQNASYGRK
jgi:hypothetical protein